MTTRTGPLLPRRCRSPELGVPGDPAGRRQFVTMAEQRPLALEGGGTLGPITIAYETWGTLASDAPRTPS